MTGLPRRRKVVLAGPIGGPHRDGSVVMTAQFATIHRFRQWPQDESEEWARALVAELLGDQRPRASLVLGRLDGTDGAVLALWDEAAEAQAAAGSGTGAQWLDTRVYRVVDHHLGAARREKPRFAQVVWLNAGGGPERAEALVRAGRERIAPAVQDLPGVIDTAVLRAEDDSIVVVTLVMDISTPEDVERAIRATPSLPWEDPSTRGNPDRVDVQRVLDAHLRADVMATVLS
jgi:hypothetical protein